MGYFGVVVEPFDALVVVDGLVFPGIGRPCRDVRLLNRRAARSCPPCPARPPKQLESNASARPQHFCPLIIITSRSHPSVAATPTPPHPLYHPPLPLPPHRILSQVAPPAKSLLLTHSPTPPPAAAFPLVQCPKPQSKEGTQPKPGAKNLQLAHDLSSASQTSIL